MYHILILLSLIFTCHGFYQGLIPSSKPFINNVHNVIRSDSHRVQMASGSVQAFNPFSQRVKNTRVKWFESDLEAFYAFVEAQPLLTAEQELQYGKALKMWINVEKKRGELSDILDLDENRLVSNEELALSVGCSVVTLQKMQKFADIAKAKLVNSNLKLVLAVVSRYRTSSVPNSELIAEGIRGLARASLRYDYSKGFRFATYATWYVHQAVADYVRWKKHPAKMPSRYLLLQRKVKQYSNDHKAEKNRLPTVDEICDALGSSRYDVVKVLSMQTYPLLLHQPINRQNSKQDGKDRGLDEIMPSLFKAPIQHARSQDRRGDMEKMMQVNLNDVERDVLRLRLGLDDGRVKPVKEVGKRFKISWKQVRNVEKEAISKLKCSEEIADFVDNCAEDL